MSHTSEAHGGGHSTHVMSPKLLLGVYGALVALTILTVSAIQIDLGGTANLIVAMGVATVKAALVVAFFMHLLYDKRFNLLIFISSVLFVVLFLSIAVLDTKQYQPDVAARERVLDTK